MSTRLGAAGTFRARRAWLLVGAVAAAGALASAAGADDGCCAECREAGPTKEQLAKGRELFLREWTVNDKRSHGGDGLGPVFNDSSCVSCHNAGGPGGGGPNSKNVDILTAASMAGFQQQVGMPTAVEMTPVRREPGFLARSLEALVGIDPPPTTAPAAAPPQPRRPNRAELIKAHAGFRTANSVVLHRFSTEPAYESMRLEMLGLGGFAPPIMAGGFGGLGDEQRAEAELNQAKSIAQFERSMGQTQSQFGEFLVTNSQRNPTALFGAGLMDSIPDDVLIAQAKVKHPGFPEIAGRVARQKDGRIGRFGWKGQTPSLEDFVLTACAVELGLEVPGHSQGGLPRKPDYKAKGQDLTAEECDALTAYVKDLPKPARVNADHPDVVAGEKAFNAIGCATCHTPKLGDVEGIYGDLLLHDLGPELGDVGQYGVFTPESSEPEIIDEPQVPIADAGAVPATPAVEAPAGTTVDPIALTTTETVPEEPPVPTVGPARIADPVVVSSAPADAPVSTGPPSQIVEGAAEITAVQVTTTPPAVFQGGMMMGGMGMGMPNGISANRPKDGPAGRQEWRTPPLWGLRDSGPYMHDGRASTLERAIALHNGEASRSARKYFALSPEERMQVQAFLKSLAAPDPTGPAVAHAAK